MFQNSAVPEGRFPCTDVQLKLSRLRLPLAASRIDRQTHVLSSEPRLMQARILNPLMRIKPYVVIIADDHEMLALWQSPCTALLLMECFLAILSLHQSRLFRSNFPDRQNRTSPHLGLDTITQI